VTKAPTPPWPPLPGSPRLEDVPHIGSPVRLLTDAPNAALAVVVKGVQPTMMVSCSQSGQPHRAYAGHGEEQRGCKGSHRLHRLCRDLGFEEESRDLVHRIDRAAALQRQYYEETASSYDDAHVTERDEHHFALSFMLSVLDDLGVQSILDVGSGTGRAVLYLRQKRLDLRAVGVEPVDGLREVGYRKGLSRSQLVPGDVMGLHYPAGAFDLVCSFGVLHHVRQPDVAIAEMLRVAKKAIFISDSNNFGQGSLLTRSIKQLLNGLRLWRCVVFIKTRGRGYAMSRGDGVTYSYSVFGNYAQVDKACGRICVLNTTGDGRNPYRAASHVALLGVKS
jgi:ubiquinone/menaquinone biosynthesis C-methylase UbiE